MRQTNIFRTTKRDHVIPRDTMIRALKRSPGKDWCDPETDAYQYLKEWALNEDVKKDGPENPVVHIFEGVEIPREVMGKAEALGNPDDKRTKAYKYIKAWINGQTN